MSHPSFFTIVLLSCKGLLCLDSSTDALYDTGTIFTNSCADKYVPDDFEARSPDELSLHKGDRIELIERDDDFGDGWYLGKHIQNGKTGLFPEGEISVIIDGGRRLTLFGSLHNNHTQDHSCLGNYHGHSCENRGWYRK